MRSWGFFPLAPETHQFHSSTAPEELNCTKITAVPLFTLSLGAAFLLLRVPRWQLYEIKDFCRVRHDLSCIAEAQSKTLN